MDTRGHTQVAETSLQGFVFCWSAAQSAHCAVSSLLLNFTKHVTEFLFFIIPCLEDIVALLDNVLKLLKAVLTFHVRLMTTAQSKIHQPDVHELLGSEHLQELLIEVAGDGLHQGL